jgi:hypothetical protein
MKKIALLVLLFPAHALAASAVNVRDFGATGNGVTDDRVAVQAALDAGAGHEVYFPAGTYLMSHQPGAFWCIKVAAGTQLLGADRAGTKLIMAPGQPASVPLIRVEDAPDVTISTMTLDGAKATQTVDPQRHGVFTKHSPRLSLRHVTAQNFSGDGFYIYDGSDDATAQDVRSTGNDRNGLTLGGGTDTTTVVKSQFVGNKAEQFDSEGGPQGGPINHVTLIGNVFDAQGASDDYVLTMTGSSASVRSASWTVTDNTVNGAALALWITDVVYARNHGVNPSTKPALYVYRTSDRIRISNNTLADTGPASFDAGGIIYIVSTNVGQSPDNVVVEDNTLSTTQPANGVTALGVRDVQIVHNTITGAGAARTSEAGVFVRTTHVDEPVEHVIVQRNTIANFGNYGVLLGGNGAAQIKRVEITGNAFRDTSVVPTMVTALNLNEGSFNQALDVTVGSNTLSGGTTTLLVHPPAGVAGAIDGTRWKIP